MQLKTLSIIYSLVLLCSACGTVERPDADICVVNAPGKKLTCYNLKHDYNQDGTLRPGAKPKFKPISSIDNLNKGVFMTNADWAEVKKWIAELRVAHARRAK